ncbi:MAG TPA: discoidin domain-containing protein [Actinocatenispora sp.]
MGVRSLLSVAAVAAGALVATAGVVAVHHGLSTSDSNAGPVLVVEANLQDAVHPADARDTADLDTFVRRLARSTPYAPDALLLTEILGPGADRVAARLSSATGHRYEVTVAGGDTAFRPDGAVRENAILLNTDTMRPIDHRGFHRVQDEDQAYAVAARRGSNVTVPLVAAHPAGDPALAASALGSFVDATFPAADNRITVLGGDFRVGRCATAGDDQPTGCEPAPYWAEVTGARGFSDATYETAGAERRTASNYLFVRGRPLRSAVDTGYAPDPSCKPAYDAGRSASAPAACRGAYYADKPFSWAEVEPGQDVQRAVVPAQVVMDRCRLADRTADVVARTVNNTDSASSEPVSVDAAAPLTATPASGTLDVPAHQGASLVVHLTAPRAGTPTGDLRITVHIGQTSVAVPVHVPESCTEPPAYATSFHAGTPPENAVDGDIATIWHSEYQPVTPLPQSITLNLGATRSVTSLSYQPRFDGNLNGTILSYQVSVSTDGATFDTVASGDWAGDARLKTVTFPAVDARYVRLTGTKGYGGEFVSAAEVTAR